MLGNLWLSLAGVGYENIYIIILFRVIRDEFQYTLFLGLGIGLGVGNRLRLSIGLRHGPRMCTGYMISDTGYTFNFLNRGNFSGENPSSERGDAACGVSAAARQDRTTDTESCPGDGRGPPASHYGHAHRRG